MKEKVNKERKKEEPQESTSTLLAHQAERTKKEKYDTSK